ncbi:MAG: bifunctional 4-hydroxy-2-oxoglutarate aldolase/2-dehydro-3-deoxy-phosphogluconate aldolase [Dethiobacter sp.]|jgi:2-dehydro-3-deoxyphosphogluconate aldolase/(4S)-4-hydroxy-2-oxoglutarate aldolase|nr:bifunctional 4-hydroxy-2-oxoglutarate aldolase/2-dehydro-3-deoxy-phosphogluconate aldolase [Dethiobacter sp.]
MNEILKRIGNLGIVPVVKIDEAKDAVPLAASLLAGGLPLAEITFRTAAAAQAIQNITAELPEVLVGAGTVLNIQQADQAIAAGAKFIVTPGFNPKVVKHCLEHNIPITPGCSSPTDLEMALEFGLETVKFFPAEASGGINTLKAISAPYKMIKFVPTGGIDQKNLMDYLSLGSVLACGGSWMVKDDLILSGNFREITRLTAEAVRVTLGFDLAHIGINAADADRSLSIAKRFAAIFNLPIKEGAGSNFAGTIIEVNKSSGLGANGHIAIKTNSLPRAIAYLERNGIEVDDSTAKGPAGGPVAAIYLKEQIGGFAVHLLQGK